MKSSRLDQKNKKQLAQLAKKQGIPRASELTKDQLLKKLSRSLPRSETVAVKKKPAAVKPSQTKAAAKKVQPAKKAPAAAASKPGKPATQKTAARSTLMDDHGTLHEFHPVGSSRFAPLPTPKHVPTKQIPELPEQYGRDRVVVLVRDPYWLHCYWELTPNSVERAQAALGADWHGSKPVLRVVDVTSEDTTAAAEAVVRDIEIHGGTNNWYVDVQNPPRSYRVDLGFLAKSGRFYVSARSNVVTTPRPGVSDKIDENYAEVQRKFDKIYAMSAGFDPLVGSSADIKQMFEERLKRPLASPTVPGLGSGGMQIVGPKGRKFWFHLDAELIVYGATEPTAKVTIQGEQVHLRPDGTFTLRFSLPDSRQIIPAVARSADGVEERTIVLAVERNTKQLEPMILDNGDI